MYACTLELVSNACGEGLYDLVLALRYLLIAG